MHELWVFQVRGGERFSLLVPGNPRATHDGVMSLFSFMLTPAQAPEVKKAIEQFDCQVTFRQTAKQTPEQQRERRALLGMGKEDTVWPAPQCPSCYWFDPRNDNPCGFEVWEPETIDQSLESYEGARTGLADCPIHGDP